MSIFYEMSKFEERFEERTLKLLMSHDDRFFVLSALNYGIECRVRVASYASYTDAFIVEMRLGRLKKDHMISFDEITRYRGPFLESAEDLADRLFLCIYSAWKTPKEEST